jgi:hypothetical protein
VARPRTPRPPMPSMPNIKKIWWREINNNPL